MNQNGLLFVLGLAALAYAARSYATDDGSGGFDWGWVGGDVPLDAPVDAGNTESTTMSDDAKINAFKKVITRFESNGDYGKLYGGGHFYDYSHHPNIRVPFHNPRKSAPGNNDYSTAAGAYQINYPTWQDIQRDTGLEEFTPDMQDIAARYLLDYEGVTPYIVDGDLATAFALASKRWASLPGSTSGQRQITLDVAVNAYNSALGVA